MNATSAVIRTVEFSAEWPGEEDPPPGKDFADALRKSLFAAGATNPYPNSDLSGDLDTDLGLWSIDVDFAGQRYSITFYFGFLDTIPPTWVIIVHKRVGCLLALFGRRERRFEIEYSFLRVVTECLVQVAKVSSITWVTETEAMKAISR